MKLLSALRQLNAVYVAFMLISFVVGVAGALQAPTLSLFLSNELQVRPFQVGLFYTVNAVAGIVMSLLLAKRSDNRGDRRRLILFCCAMAVGNTLLFAWNRDYLTLITVGVLLASLASVAIPQIFALAREYADRSGREVVMFSSLMRAQLSLAWVIGPPLSFALAMNFGFTAMYLVAAGLFVLCLLLVWRLLPAVPRAEASGAPGSLPASAWRSRDVQLLFLASLLMWTSNTAYIIDIPLYISHDLGLPEDLAGWLMGFAAALEIPAMLLAGWLVKRCGKRKMMLVALAAGMLFYPGVALLHSREALLALQLLNAVFVGIIAGIGMLWFQDLMPGRPGAATTLFTNSITTGVIFSGMIQGTLAQAFGHQSIYWVAFLLVMLAFGLCWRVRDV